MTPTQLSALLVELLSLPAETEWVEWKHNNDNPDMIAERISALANSAALHGREFGYLVWGVEDSTKKVVGTTFRPRQSKKGNEELENWLMRSQHPQVSFQIFEWSHQGVPVVLFQIPRASQAPVRFGSEEFVRIGSLTKKLKEYTEKERELWAILSRKPFETGIAKADVDGPDVLKLLDFDRCFKLLQIPLPTDQQGILGKLVDEVLILPKPGSRFDVTNLGAILFATDLNKFEWLGRKALRIIKYKGDGRTNTEREWRDAPSQMGYAVAFEAAVAFINSQLPQNEPIGQAFRQEVRVYPERPAPDFTAISTTQPGFTKATLFAPRKLNETDSKERIRACYQHACLCFVTGSRMTNTILRNRFGIKPESSAQASRLIREALKTQVIKLYDPDVRDRDRSYVPFWA
jgi:ATP-dependent DNA helicase RecG